MDCYETRVGGTNASFELTLLTYCLVSNPASLPANWQIASLAGELFSG